MGNFSRESQSIKKESNGNSITEKYSIWNKKLSGGFQSHMTMMEKRASEPEGRSKEIIPTEYERETRLKHKQNFKDLVDYINW